MIWAPPKQQWTIWGFTTAPRRFWWQMLKVLTPSFLNEICFKVLQSNLYMIVGNLHINQGVESKRNFSNHSEVHGGWAFPKPMNYDIQILDKRFGFDGAVTGWAASHECYHAALRYEFTTHISLQKLVYSRDLRWCDSVDVKYFNPTYMILSLHICCMGRAMNLQQKMPRPLMVWCSKRTSTNSTRMMCTYYFGWNWTFK